MEKIMAAMAMVVVALLTAAGGGEATVYMVGDSAGWTILNSPNYTAWALSKTFHVGDAVVFEYNKQFHNVMEVNENDYKSCSAASPIATYITGNDSVALKRKGHYYFLCGFPGHCDAGQKVDINVAATASSAAPSEAPSPSTSPAPAPAPASAPASNASTAVGGSPGSSPSQGNSAAAGSLSKVLAIAAAVVSFAAAGGVLMH